MWHFIKEEKGYGRGLYSLHTIPKDIILFTAELLVLSEEDTKLVNTTDLKYYTFTYNDKQDCLVLGDGEMFNHSDSPNVGFKLIDYDGRKRMAFFTLKDVSQYEQLFINYNADVIVNTNEYNNKNLY